MKLKISVLLILLSGYWLKAQQGTVFNLYFQDHYYLNPAAAGSKGISVFSMSAKEFWLGFPDKTPGTQVISYNTRLGKINPSFNKRKRYSRKGDEGKVGIGAMLYNDINGPIRKTGILLTYAYHVRLHNSNLSFGISSFSYQVFTDNEKLKLKYTGDPYLNESEAFYATDANIGAYLTGKDYFLSVSAHNLLESQIKLEENEYITYIDARQYDFMSGYTFTLNNQLDFEPSMLFQTDEQFSTRMDLNFKLMYNKKFWFGIGISSKSTLNAFVGIISDQFDFGYSFQLPEGDVIQYSLGAHEIMFSIKFGDNKFNRYSRSFR